MGWFTRRVPPRLKLWPTPTDLRRMARHPSAYAPTVAEVLTPAPVPSPTVRMTTDERRLMDAVLADPDADEPRLRYADWVEGCDPERAGFIREALTPRPPLPVTLPCGEAGEGEKEGTSSLPLSRRSTAPGSRERGPGGEGFKLWGARDLVFCRGFVEGMSLTGRSFVSLSDGLFAATPLREVRLVAVNFLMAELVRCPNLAKLRRLDLRGNQIGPDGAAHLAGCLYFGSLTELDVSRNALGDVGVRSLLAAGWVRNLRLFAVADNGLSAELRAELEEMFGNRALL